MTKIAIIYYSTYGHVATMANAVKKGIQAAGATCDVFQVPETLPKEVLSKMGAPPKGEDPIITPAELVDYDGFIFGCSGRYGAFPAQMKVCGII
jgi:NAD(P)H dehydrogenase (quinone)